MGYVTTAIVSGVIGTMIGIGMMAVCKAAHDADEQMLKMQQKKEQAETEE